MSDTLTASTIGTAVSSALMRAPGGGLIGEVTHAFPSSLYLRTPGDSLIFITERKLRSPITVNINSSANMNNLVSPGDRFFSRGTKVITADGFGIELAQASRYEQSISQKPNEDLDRSEISDALNVICFILRIIDTSQSALDPKGLISLRISKFVRTDLFALVSDPGSSSIPTAMELVGAGHGFTPSGDDFLGGFLAAYNSLAPAVRRRQILLPRTELLKRTSWHSALLLDFMQSLVLDEQLMKVCTATHDADADLLIDAIQDIAPRGHTSGIDITLGIVFALSLALDLKFPSNSIEKTMKYLGMDSKV